MIVGIKPVKIEDLLSHKTYLMYTRLASGAPSLKPYLRQVVDSKISVIDYECIKD